MKWLAWFEETALSTWVREEWWVFPLILCMHAVGMALIAGGNFAIALRLLGVARGASLSGFKRFFPIMWFGFAVNALSGVLLLAGYPAKALTNPLFYLKLSLLASAIALMQRLARALANEFDHARMKRFALLSLALWTGVIATGRLLAYTHSVLLAAWYSA